MSLWANDSKGNRVTITPIGGVSKGDISDKFYCPSCGRTMSFVSESSNKRSAHFQGRHEIGCDIGYTSTSDILYNYKFTEDSLNDFLNKLKKEGVKNALPINGYDGGGSHPREKFGTIDSEKHFPKKVSLQTLRQLFGILVNADPSDILYGTTMVKDIYCGRSTSYLYKNYVTGLHLVYAQFHSYNRETGKLYFCYPTEGKKQFEIIVGFSNVSLFDSFIKKHYNHVHDFFIMLADFNSNKASLYSSAQIIRLGK